MSEESVSDGNRSITIGGDMGDQSVVISGDKNVVISKLRHCTFLFGSRKRQVVLCTPLSLTAMRARPYHGRNRRLPRGGIRRRLISSRGGQRRPGRRVFHSLQYQLQITTLCWAAEGRVDYALEGIIVTRGATVKWLRDQLGLIVKSADRIHGSGGRRQRRRLPPPRLQRNGRPHWKMDARAAIAGLTFGSNKNHIARAALESAAFQIKDVIQAMQQDSGAPSRS